MRWSALFLALGLVVATGIVAPAATYTFTEGDGQNRALVAGSVDLDDAADADLGFDLDLSKGSPFVAGDILQVHGRIASAVDLFTFSIAEGATARIAFDFDGYELGDGRIVGPAASGLVDQPTRGGPPSSGSGTGKPVAFFLIDQSGVSGDEIGTIVYQTNRTGASGVDASIFDDLSSGRYTLGIAGRGAQGNAADLSGQAALYDVTISVVPLPMPAALLIAGLGGLLLVGRRARV